MRDERTYGRWMQYLVLGASLVLVLLLLLSLVLDQGGQEWKKIQKEYAGIMEAESAAGLAEHPDLEVGIYELSLPALGVTDRCISCHHGLEEPREPALAQPHGLHPGNILEDHPMDDYGCTVCHGGQGGALNREEAFARDENYHWAHPLLEQPYLQSSCGKCHLTLFSVGNDRMDTEGMGVLLEGRELFAREGCLGCHQARGVGGILGPDLTTQGEKTRHEYSFRNISGDQSVSHWLKEHFRDPEMVSPGSQMLKIDLPEEDLNALATLVMGLTKPDYPLEYFSLATLSEFKGERSQLEGSTSYGYLCAACHGKQGQGKDYEEYSTGVAAIGKPDFLRVASVDLIRFTMDKGRSGRQMSAWAPDLSGITIEELDLLAEFIHERHDYGGAGRSGEEGLQAIHSQKGVSSKGLKLFEESCATCHGTGGGGGFAVALRQEGLLGRADDKFLLQTIWKGRPNTAMPAWWTLSDGELSDLIALLGAWRLETTGRSRPVLSSAPVDHRKGDALAGEKNFRFLCFRCHGEFGEGHTGPSNINQSFLAAASDAFLYETIAGGRKGTAMFGWMSDVYNQERLEKQDIADLLAFMRAEAGKKPAYLYAGSNPGQSTEGEVLYRELCKECHGTGGEGTKAPALNRQEFLNAATNGYLFATISVGRADTKMPAWGYGESEYRKLSQEEREDLVAYLRSMQRIRIKY